MPVVVTVVDVMESPPRVEVEAREEERVEAAVVREEGLADAEMTAEPAVMDWMVMTSTLVEF